MLEPLQYEVMTPAGFTGNARAADLHISPDGRFAYASVRETKAIVVYRIDASNGRLAPVQAIDVVASPRSFALDPAGRVLICAGQTDSVVAVYAIDEKSGKLALRHEVQVAANPSWVEALSLDG